MPVTALPLDTHRLITQLKEHGFSEDQAAGDLRELELRLENGLKELELHMTIKLGSIVAVGVAFLAALKVFA